MLSKIDKEVINKVIKNPFLLLELAFFRYLVIGSTTFILDFALYQILVSFFNFQEIHANLTSVFISLFYNFTLSNFWTFRAGKGKKLKKTLRYAILATFNYSFNNVTFAFLVTYSHLPDLIAKALVTIAIMCWNFFLYKFWVFQKAD